VSSDDSEILEYAQEMGVIALQRSESLSKDDTTLDPVVYDATVRAEEMLSKRFDYIVTLQPTSPNLSTISLGKALEVTIGSEVDTMLSVVNKPCLSWRREGSSILPNYSNRLNRQLLPDNYVEAGAFIICKRLSLTPKSRIGTFVNVYELSEQEGSDIDTIEEWVLSEALIKRKRIAFRADGDRQLGMGHIYRCLTLAYSLTGHEICFISNKNHPVGVEKLKNSFFTCYEIESDDDTHTLVKQIKPDILVMDVLNTEKNFVMKLKENVERLITFEDMGTGTDVADAVINSLFSNKDNRSHVYTGYKFADLRDEFLLKNPKNFSTKVENVFIMFGGADPANYTKKCYDMICNNIEVFKGIKFNIVAGLAYDSVQSKILDRPDDGVYVFNNSSKVSWFMQQADLAITSQGRSTFELASLAVPSIVMAQNQREKSHGFASLENGFLNLGFGRDITEETLLKTLIWLIDTPQMRSEMREIMLGLDIRKGINRVKQIILGESI